VDTPALTGPFAAFVTTVREIISLGIPRVEIDPLVLSCRRAKTVASQLRASGGINVHLQYFGSMTMRPQAESFRARQAAKLRA